MLCFTLSFISSSSLSSFSGKTLNWFSVFPFSRLSFRGCGGVAARVGIIKHPDLLQLTAIPPVEFQEATRPGLQHNSAASSGSPSRHFLPLGRASISCFGIRSWDIRVIWPYQRSCDCSMWSSNGSMLRYWWMSVFLTLSNRDKPLTLGRLYLGSHFFSHYPTLMP